MVRLLSGRKVVAGLHTHLYGWSNCTNSAIASHLPAHAAALKHTIVSAVAVLLLSGVVAFYAQRELAKLAGGELDAQAASRWSEVV